MIHYFPVQEADGSWSVAYVRPTRFETLIVLQCRQEQTAREQAAQMNLDAVSHVTGPYTAGEFVAIRGFYGNDE